MRIGYYFLGFLLALGALGQDMQYSQYYANPLYLNPAFTGAVPNHRVSINHRIQWPSLPRAFANYSASYDVNASHLNSGFGVLLSSDQAGSANLRNTSAAFNYSYAAVFDHKLVFKPAVSFGYVSRSIDYNKLVFGDQIDFGIDGAPSQDPSVTAIESNTYADLGAGFLVYNRNLWIGISGFHLNKPNNSLINGENYLPGKYSFHAGARFVLGNKRFKDLKKASIAPSFIYKFQGDFKQLDLGASFHYEPVIVGLYYRGMPFIKSQVPNTINHDALILLFGVEYKNFQFGYSFDSSISQLAADTGGAHEFSIQYYFELHTTRRGTTRRQKFLLCPAFNNRLFK